MTCEQATQDVCHDTLDCTGSLLLSMNNPVGWDLSTTDWMERVVSFSCFKNGTWPALPTAVGSLDSPKATTM
ncbi:hypothetical protein F5B20DRAFT_539137 [Whalleya microplaca]|nr:hypothetical protein F5B20DRAFT_539137 [Whalleya microplaca]